VVTITLLTDPVALWELTGEYERRSSLTVVAKAIKQINVRINSAVYIAAFVA